MKSLIKVLAGLGAIVLTATAVAVPDLCIKSPVAVHTTAQAPSSRILSSHL
jgi:hypothetical protein